jgi:hypothetical protein
MNEKMNEAYEELKRVEHLIYVSLKYTRTVDVILNILTRMTDGYALMVDALIEYETEQGKVTFEPESIIERAMLVKQVFANDDVVVDNMELYLLLRKLLRAKNVERENEYRRYVTMKTIVDGREEIVTIDIITNYCLYQREFFSHVRTIIEGKSAVEVVQQAMEQPQAPAWMRESEAVSAARESDVAIEEEINKSTKTNTPPPPTKQPMKVRPVTAPPRKRAPRPKKYKIQIPKGKNAIMTPEYMPVIRAAIEAEKQKKAAAASKVAAKTAAKAAAKANSAKAAAKKGAKAKAPAKKSTSKAKPAKAAAKKLPPKAAPKKHGNKNVSSSKKSSISSEPAKPTKAAAAKKKR